MITIKITNTNEIVERKSNWFIAKLASYFVDVQTRVENEIAREIEKALIERKIQAVVSVVKED